MEVKVETVTTGELEKAINTFIKLSNDNGVAGEMAMGQQTAQQTLAVILEGARDKQGLELVGCLQAIAQQVIEDLTPPLTSYQEGIVEVWQYVDSLLTDA